MLRPRVSLPILLGVVLLLALLALGNVHDVVLLIGRFQPRYLAAFAAMMLGYEAIRCLQWRFLLNALGIHVPVRTQVFTYVTGEVMKSLPLGNYFPDVVLQRSQGTDFGRATSVTLAINLLEVALTLVGLVVLGVRGWDWLRPLIVCGLAGVALVVWLFIRGLAWSRARQTHFPRRLVLPVLCERLVTLPSVRHALEELRQFRAGSVELLRPRVLLPAALFSASYLLLGGVGLALLAWGLGLQQVTLGQALAVYFFSLAFATIIPLPMDLGSTELGGVGVFLALGVGVGKSAAVGVMVLDRTLALGSTLALALVVGLVLQAEVRAELRAFLRVPGRRSVQAPAQAPAAAAPHRKSLRSASDARVWLSWAGNRVRGLVPRVGGLGLGREAACSVALCTPCGLQTGGDDTQSAGRNATDRLLSCGWSVGAAVETTRLHDVAASPVAACRCEHDADGHEGHLAA